MNKDFILNLSVNIYKTCLKLKRKNQKRQKSKMLLNLFKNLPNSDNFYIMLMLDTHQKLYLIKSRVVNGYLKMKSTCIQERKNMIKLYKS